jgi:aromatic-L-amino-acid decarboxylase
MVDWMADYLEHPEKYPVKSRVRPGDIARQLPEKAPEEGEETTALFSDFKEIILPGITHWQNPNFYAYFPANSSPPSILAEMLTATLGAQCMMWETSPAAAELEEKMMQWLRQMLGLPEHFEGVIQDTASTATLCAFLSAREQASRFRVNESGFNGSEKFRIYGSTETHSSIEKAVRIAGMGRQNLVKVEVDEQFRMNPQKLKQGILDDLEQGHQPLCIVATLGTTGTTSIDPLAEIVAISKEFKVWLHVDAAMAGSALVLPEYRWMIQGMEQVDSFVFNPHKWMFTNFDCSAYFVKDPDLLIKTFEILPEYLKTWSRGQVNDYRDWGIPLGRRFRALKLWFVIRHYGVDGIRQKFREHLRITRQLESWIRADRSFEITAPVPLNTICFRYHPEGMDGIEELNQFNESLLYALNASGKLFLSHTKINGMYVLRIVIGQTYVTAQHVQDSWALIQETAREMDQ